MVDDLPPNKVEVRKTAESLGFKVDTERSTRFKKTHKSLILDIEKGKVDWKVMLGLTYYSSTIWQSIKLDSVICKLLVRHYYSTNSQSAMSIEELINKVLAVRKLMRHEFIEMAEQR